MDFRKILSLCAGPSSLDGLQTENFGISFIYCMFIDIKNNFFSARGKYFSSFTTHIKNILPKHFGIVLKVSFIYLMGRVLITFISQAYMNNNGNDLIFKHILKFEMKKIFLTTTTLTTLSEEMDAT